MELVKKIVTGVVIIAVIVELMLPDGWPRWRRPTVPGAPSDPARVHRVRRGAVA